MEEGCEVLNCVDRCMSWQIPGLWERDCQWSMILRALPPTIRSHQIYPALRATVAVALAGQMKRIETREEHGVEACRAS